MNYDTLEMKKCLESHICKKFFTVSTLSNNEYLSPGFDLPLTLYYTRMEDRQHKHIDCMNLIWNLGFHDNISIIYREKSSINNN